MIHAGRMISCPEFGPPELTKPGLSMAAAAPRMHAEKNRDLMLPLNLACVDEAQGNGEVVRMLVEAGGDIDGKCWDVTPLMAACSGRPRARAPCIHACMHARACSHTRRAHLLRAAVLLCDTRRLGAQAVTTGPSRRYSS